MIFLLEGPSGSGKSTAILELEKRCRAFGLNSVSTHNSNTTYTLLRLQMKYLFRMSKKEKFFCFIDRSWPSHWVHRWMEYIRGFRSKKEMDRMKVLTDYGETISGVRKYGLTRRGMFYDQTPDQALEQALYTVYFQDARDWKVGSRSETIERIWQDICVEADIWGA